MATKSRQAVAGHSAGIYADMTLDGPEIGTLVIVVDRAKNLPNRKTMGKQDPYCAMRLAKEAKKTATDRRGGQTPKWDQELRFNVHDSPDYYKLKCSLFNDDKKADLIGEAWIDLADVIKPGGGQRDIWQQLNFKGKYAGDIRIELTYYDIREKPVENKASSEGRYQNHISNDGMAANHSKSAKQLGPRDLQRRPLPANPVSQYSQAASVSHQIQQTPHYPSQIPAGGNDYESLQMYAPVPVRPQEHHQDEYHEYEEDYSQHYTSDFQQDQEFSLQYHEDTSMQAQKPWQYPLGKEYHDFSQASDAYYPHTDESFEPDSHSSLSLPLSSHSDSRESPAFTRPMPYQANSEPSSPYSSPLAVRPMPSPANSDGQIPQYRNKVRSSVSPTKTQAFKDSPLRYSMNAPDEIFDADHQTTNEAVAPPPPPKHQDTPPRKHSQSEYPPTSYMPQPLRIGAKRTSFTDRSPLQSLEDSSNARRLSGSTPPQTPQKDNNRIMKVGTPQQQIDVHHRSRSSYNIPSGSPHNTQQQQNSYREDMDDYNPMTKDLHQARFETKSGHPSQNVYERRSVSPNPSMNQYIARKSVGMDGPYPSLDERRLSVTPYGPDSYDVFNPGSSPITNEGTPYETPEQARDSARMRDIENSRNQGPIIDNDGHEIDPSDHLPTDTWAPEPEKKHKKPEHVIHIRSKNSSSTPVSNRASPLTARAGSESPYQHQQFQNSPQPSTPSHSAGRNRLQRPISARPLPTEPYQRAQPPQPSVVSEQQTQSPSQNHTRRNSYRNDLSSPLSRPSPSEYQVPMANRYMSRESSSSQHQVPLTPTKTSNTFGTGYRNQDQRSSHHGGMSVNVFDDPLVAEMSMIDIGPSRGSAGRTRPRQNRGY